MKNSQTKVNLYADDTAKTAKHQETLNNDISETAEWSALKQIYLRMKFFSLIKNISSKYIGVI